MNYYRQMLVESPGDNRLSDVLQSYLTVFYIFLQKLMAQVQEDQEKGIRNQQYYKKVRRVYIDHLSDPNNLLRPNILFAKLDRSRQYLNEASFSNIIRVIKNDPQKYARVALATIGTISALMRVLEPLVKQLYKLYADKKAKKGLQIIAKANFEPYLEKTTTAIISGRIKSNQQLMQSIYTLLDSLIIEYPSLQGSSLENWRIPSSLR